MTRYSTTLAAIIGVGLLGTSIDIATGTHGTAAFIGAWINRLCLVVGGILCGRYQILSSQPYQIGQSVIAAAKAGHDQGQAR